jgi:hypothetical protein
MCFIHEWLMRIRGQVDKAESVVYETHIVIFEISGMIGTAMYDRTGKTFQK